MRSLFVILDRSVVGELIQTDGGEHRFSYVGARTAPISLSMPVDGGQFRHRVVDPFLEGLLPDQASVREALAARYGVSPRNPFALLEHIGLDCAGAVRFADAEHLTRALDDDGELVALSEEEIGARLAALEEGREPSWIAPGEGWSLAGVQTKIALRREGGQWYEARGCEPTTHILKPGITRMKEQALDEHLCLTTLREIGIPAARTRYARLGGREALIVERYDRLREGGRVRRIHQEDLCQATSTYPRRKYEADGGPGALQIIDLLARWGDRDGASIRRFVDALIVNVLLGAPTRTPRTTRSSTWATAACSPPCTTSPRACPTPAARTPSATRGARRPGGPAPWALVASASSSASGPPSGSAWPRTPGSVRGPACRGPTSSPGSRGSPTSCPMPWPSSSPASVPTTPPWRARSCPPCCSTPSPGAAPGPAPSCGDRTAARRDGRIAVSSGVAPKRRGVPRRRGRWGPLGVAAGRPAVG